MSRMKTLHWTPVAILSAALALVPAAFSADTNLSGTVKSSNGKRLEGAAVSARSDDKTFTTTVYTNREGDYFFPLLPSGHYKMWTQAKGFDAERAELEIAAGKEGRQDFSLKPFPDISKQLSGSEWLASLPSETLQDRRMKAFVRNNCADCHSANFILQNRFDKDGWSKILNLMTGISYWAEIRENPAAADELAGREAVIAAYRDELSEYLARARGPNSLMQFKPYPKLTGESLQIVVTEYDVPIGRGDKGEYIPTRHTGAIWSEGAPSAYEGRGIHDVTVDPEGNVWFGDDGVRAGANRSLAKLDPKTGHVTGYRLDLADGEPMWDNGGTGIRLDPTGKYIWFRGGAGHGAQFKASDGGGSKGRLIRFDPKTEKREVFPPSDSNAGINGTGSDFDSQGRLWGWRTGGGLVRLDPQTKKYEDFVLADSPYGIAVDANDNTWFTILERDQIGFIDKKTGSISLTTLSPMEVDFVTPKDREIATRLSSGGRAAPILWGKGPRKMAADKKGDKVWFALYYASAIGSVDINTKEIKEYPLPQPDYTPYHVGVDKNHMVWILPQNADRILKFNPFTEQFTEYPLPTLGTGPRHIYVDNNTDPPTIWQPYWRISRVARVQFRTGRGASVTASGR